MEGLHNNDSKEYSMHKVKSILKNNNSNMNSIDSGLKNVTLNQNSNGQIIDRINNHQGSFLEEISMFNAEKNRHVPS